MGAQICQVLSSARASDPTSLVKGPPPPPPFLPCHLLMLREMLPPLQLFSLSSARAAADAKKLRLSLIAEAPKKGKKKREERRTVAAASDPSPQLGAICHKRGEDFCISAQQACRSPIGYIRALRAKNVITRILSCCYMCDARVGGAVPTVQFLCAVLQKVLCKLNGTN